MIHCTVLTTASAPCTNPRPNDHTSLLTDVIKEMIPPNAQLNTSFSPCTSQSPKALIPSLMWSPTNGNPPSPTASGRIIRVIKATSKITQKMPMAISGKPIVTTPAVTTIAASLAGITARNDAILSNSAASAAADCATLQMSDHAPDAGPTLTLIYACARLVDFGPLDRL